jgi:hypothetical protein
MGLLTKALEITWAKPEDLEVVVICEGGMHLLMAILAGIGYIYGDVDLESLYFKSQGSLPLALLVKSVGVRILIDACMDSYWLMNQMQMLRCPVQGLLYTE